MALATRILVVCTDNQVGRWLQHRLETIRDGCRIEIDAMADFEHRLATTGTHGFDLLFAVLDFTDGISIANSWLERALSIPGTPPVIVVAEHGNELAAVAALHRGATDYIPRQMVTTELLTASIEHALAAPVGPAHSGGDASFASQLKAPRDLIPRYMLLDVLGESARATVYLAHSAALDRHVALKVSQVNDGEEPQFSREFQTVGGLRHPGVVDIYDYGMHESREFIAMEYFACGDLKARLQNPLSEHEAVNYLSRIAAALSVVHNQGVLHRDLKPPNIMLREDGQIVLIDFGIAKNIVNSTRSTAAGVLRGSPYYMSPEQAQGLELDARSDLYSLGVIFFEMLTGTKPYLGTTAIEVLQLHVAGPIPELPPHLAHHQALLEGMMAKTAEERFASAADLLASLERVAA